MKYSYSTPYGNLRIVADVSINNFNTYDIIHEKLSKLLSLSLYKERIENDIGSYGPWYRITNYKGMPIPTSNLINPVTIKYHETKRKFN